MSLAADLWLLSEEVAYLVDVAGSLALPGIFFMAVVRGFVGGQSSGHGRRGGPGEFAGL